MTQRSQELPSDRGPGENQSPSSQEDVSSPLARVLFIAGTGDPDKTPASQLPARTAHSGAESLRNAFMLEEKPLPELAVEHLKVHPFQAPENVAERSFWYEGTFDPLGPHHLEVILGTFNLGFERATLGIVFQNPYKPNSSPFEDRYQMAKLALEDAGLDVHNDPSRPGVCIHRVEESFHIRRMEAIFDPKVNILLGPDNFDNAYRNDILWVHPPAIRENPTARKIFGFRGLCCGVDGFLDKLLVYPRLHDIHATDIRQGTKENLPAVAKYAADNGLYKQAAPTSKTHTPSSSAPTLAVDKKNSLTHEDALLRHAVQQKVCSQLSQQGLFNEKVNAAVNRRLNSFDTSEFHELKLALETDCFKCRTGRESDHVQAVRSLRLLRRDVMETLLGNDIEIAGSDNVLSALMEQKKIIFIGNHSGWADLALLPLALRANGLSAISGKISFIVEDEIFKSSSFLQSFIGRSVDRVTIPLLESDHDESGKIPLTEALRTGVSRLRHEGALAFFPENLGSDCGVQLFSHAFLDFINTEKMAALGIDMASVTVIPWAQRGGATIVKGNGDSFSEEVSPLVLFGKPLSSRALAEIATEHGPAVAAQVVGSMVANLLPKESRGVYGPHGTSYLQKDNSGRITQDDLLAIKQGMSIAEAISGSDNN